MDKRYLLIFSFLFINTLAYTQSYKESKVVAHLNGGEFREGYKLPTPKFCLE
jgi:hypothetical protein